MLLPVPHDAGQKGLRDAPATTPLPNRACLAPSQWCDCWDCALRHTSYCCLLGIKHCLGSCTSLRAAERRPAWTPAQDAQGTHTPALHCWEFQPMTQHGARGTFPAISFCLCPLPRALAAGRRDGCLQREVKGHPLHPHFPLCTGTPRPLASCCFNPLVN